MKPVRILLVSGSTRAGSSSRAVLRTAYAVAPGGVTTVLYTNCPTYPPSIPTTTTSRYTLPSLTFGNTSPQPTPCCSAPRSMRVRCQALQEPARLDRRQWRDVRQASGPGSMLLRWRRRLEERMLTSRVTRQGAWLRRSSYRRACLRAHFSGPRGRRDRRAHRRPGDPRAHCGCCSDSGAPPQCDSRDQLGSPLDVSPSGPTALGRQVHTNRMRGSPPLVDWPATGSITIRGLETSFLNPSVRPGP